MSVAEGRQAKPRRARQPSMRDHQGPMRARSGAARRWSAATRASRASPASATTPTSVRTSLPMEAGSMSMWIFFEPGEKASSRPVTRSSKRAPTAIITSQSCMAWLAS